MPTLTVTSTVADNNHDGSQTWAQRATASPTALFTGGTTIVGPNTTTSNLRAYFFIFRFGDGTSGSGIAQGSDITSATLNLRFNNGITSAALSQRIYIAVENNLDPLGTGAIVSGTLGSMPWRRLGRQSDAVTLLGARAGPTHSGDISTTGVGVTDTSAYIYKAFADGRTINATSMNLTDSFAPALQKLIDDPSWNGDSQYVMVNVFSDPNVTAGTDGVGLLNGITWASGQTGTSTTYSSSAGQLILRDSNASYAAQLIVDVDLPVTNASFTTTAPVMNASVPTQSALAYVKYPDLDYHDSFGNTTRRTLDVYVPTGTAPSGGFPVAFFVHGGAFNAGSKSDVATSIPFLTDVFNRNMAIVSINYKFTEGDLIFNTNTGWVRPSTTQDTLAALKHIKTVKATYNLNDEKIIGFGYSAGGHVLFEALLARQDPNRESKVLTYRGASTALGSRYGDYTANTVLQTRSITDIPMPKGFLSFAGPVNIKNTHDNNAIVAPLIKIYFGQLPNNGYPGVTGEGNLDSYIKAEAGTIYSTGSPIVPTYPIALMYATGDTTVVTSSSYTPLESALSTVGYDVSQASNGNVATGVAFSRYGTAISGNGGGHDTIVQKYDRTFFQNWLDTALALAGGVETTSDITKGAQYAVRTTTTPTKSATYAVASLVSTTKSAQYLVSRLVSTTKSAQYTVSSLVNITKTGNYLIRKNADITKTASYVVSSTANITKTAQYTVPSTTSQTKTAQYLVRVTSTFTRPAVYVVPALVNITKSTQYAVAKSTTVTKTAQYAVLSLVNITKSAQYTVPSTTSLTKTTTYAVRAVTTADITKTAVYAVLTRPTITKTAVYVVPTAGAIDINKTAQYMVGVVSNITKTTTYAVKSLVSTSKPASYLVGYPSTTTKSAQYAVLTTPTITKTTAYEILGNGAITKPAQYLVVSTNTITKTGNYNLGKTTTQTKSTTYVIIGGGTITKQAQYVVKSTQTLTKTGNYNVARTTSTTKTAQYVVLVAGTLTKSAQYAVRALITNSLNSGYAVSTIKNITKGASYEVVKVTTISRGAIYTVIFGGTITKPAEYGVFDATATPEISEVIQISQQEIITIYESNNDFVISM